ncbi:hypothetical protein SAMD00023353_0500780 [Rosellinia necatrix]|uniref:Uncharacterized protein n=1 Tax=Rosellinia necatrix TaxID=77044 RepID=A0A1S7UKX1_ROSNE|nr:hypothetical protein SAMD00023353_0500780 [Rosellinia necatrix]
MASPRNNTFEDLPNSTAVLDASPSTTPTTPTTEHTFDELESLAAELSEAARQCYDKRLHHDADSMLFRLNEQERASDCADLEARLAAIRSQAALLTDCYHEAAAGVNGNGNDNGNDSGARAAEQAMAELETALLHAEQQRLAGALATLDHADRHFAGTAADLASVRDPAARAALKVALARLQDALRAYRRAFEHHGSLRSAAIDRALSGGSPPSSSSSCSSSSSSSSSWISSSSDSSRDDYDSNDDDDARSSTAATEPSTPRRSPPSSSSTSISTPDIGSPVSVVDRGLGELTLSAQNDEDEAMFRFDRASPPTLARLAAWLGLEGGAVSAALLLNEGPIQGAFAAYRAAAAAAADRPSCAEEPAILRSGLPLFTYERESLLRWHGHLARQPRRGGGGDMSAALFANRVVRYLERSCDVVPWEPVAGDLGSLAAYETARRRWAVVLQVYWFMEKAFSKVSLAG